MDLRERSAAGFDARRLREVQAKTIQAMHGIAREFRPGMLEDEALELTARRLQELGFKKNWHRPYVRFGRNTCLIYGKASVPDTRLQAQDIFFLDIGTVMDGYEGDAGDTYVIGGGPSKMQSCADAARTLWHTVRDAWQQRKLAGPALYQFAQAEALRMGWTLNMDWDGHRVADFPHHAYYKGSLAAADLVPAPDIWILEIHLCDPDGNFGAFYEDLLS
jgi:Metallopeptidase family M24